MTSYHCTNCHRPYPEEGVPYKCPVCGGVFDIEGGITFDASLIDNSQSGMWRYRHSFGLPEDAPLLTLGEGNTPLVFHEAFDKQAAFKLEYLSPTGSFKDRLTAPEVSFLLSRGVREAVEDSSGNAGASFAAYAARAGIRGRVFVPDYASGPKLAQIEAYGAEAVRILGSRAQTAEAVLRIANREQVVYASHAYLPHGLAGLATIAYELVEDLGGAPGSVVAPVGHGSLLYGIAKGFEALKSAGVVGSFPALIGVQARACAPLWAVSQMGPDGLLLMSEGETLAEGVRVRKPLRGDALLRWMEANEGAFVAVEEEDILPGRDQLARRGFYVEPTSAIVWNALEQVADRLPEPIVVILTGSGYKSKE